VLPGPARHLPQHSQAPTFERFCVGDLENMTGKWQALQCLKIPMPAAGQTRQSRALANSQELSPGLEQTYGALLSTRPTPPAHASPMALQVARNQHFHSLFQIYVVLTLLV
jgi:hypothetical protein